MNTKYLFVMLLAAATTFVACKKDKIEKNTADQLEKIAELTAQNGTKVALWANSKQLSVGYNPVYFSVTAGETIIKDKAVTIYPEMDMHTMKHSSPVE